MRHATRLQERAKRGQRMARTAWWLARGLYDLVGGAAEQIEPDELSHATPSASREEKSERGGSVRTQIGKRLRGSNGRKTRAEEAGIKGLAARVRGNVEVCARARV